MMRGFKRGSGFVRLIAILTCAAACGLLARSAQAQIGPLWQDPRWQWEDPYLPGAPWFPPPSAYPVPVPVPIPQPLPQSVRIDSKLIPDPPLPPARVELVNPIRDPLRVELIDLRQDQVISRHEIPPSSSVTLSLPRHSGGTLIETYQTYGPWGDVSQREVTRRIPPQVLYELAVHRWQMQSIAIDRTGKSPSPIEDVQFAGQGIGRFRLPAGEALRDGRIDVYRAAIGAANPGSVGPLFPSEDDPGRRDPLREALEGIGR